MPESPERTALLDLYSTAEPDGLPIFLDELYPRFLSTCHHLGYADSCPNGGPRIFYGAWDFECDGGTTLVRAVEWGRPQTPVRTALYRLYDRDGELLYVGITDSPKRRFKDHADDKCWWPDVTARTVDWLPTRAHALAAEAQAIRTESPRFNFHHNGANRA